MVIYYTHNYSSNKGESHRLLELAIGEYLAKTGDTSVDAAGLVAKMEIGEMGKPSIPGWAAFSISHCKNSWAVLIADGMCGLDIQNNSTDNYVMIAERWYRDDEAESVKATGADEFFRIWTRREAMVKAVGTSIISSQLPSTMNDVVEYEGATWELANVSLPGGESLHAAVCAEKLEDIEYIELQV